MSSRRNIALVALLVVVILIAGGEIAARKYFGLGTPPLYMAHQTIEYMFKPNQDVSRFGNRMLINEYGMRTRAFERDKREGEFRVLVFGDSVLNGGSLTDHSALATTILEKGLGGAANDILVTNISAGSWGPGNWLAYAQEYGFFDADIVVLVISSHDYADNPRFERLNENTHPTERPLSAIAEGLLRYAPRYFPSLETDGAKRNPDLLNHVVTEEEVSRGLQDLRDFLKLAAENSSRVLVFHHSTKRELEGASLLAGEQEIKKVCASMGIEVQPLEPHFRRSMLDGRNPYRDDIHPNEIGQQLIARAILEALTDELRSSERSSDVSSGR